MYLKNLFLFFRSRTSLRGAPLLASEEPDQKNCCGVAVTQTVSIRWFIVMIAFVGICCSVVGTVLGAMKASGREHLTVSLLMIGKDSFAKFLVLFKREAERNTRKGMYCRDEIRSS